MELKKEIIINAPHSTVWRILFDEFADVGQWATSIAQSEVNPNIKLIGGEELEGRVCTTPFGRTVENFTAFDEQAHRFSYEVEAGLPFGMKRAANTWQATPMGDKTKVTMQLVMETNVFPGVLMRPMLFIQMRNLVNGILEELTHYAETGSIHPRKQKALRKAAAAA